MGEVVLKKVMEDENYCYLVFNEHALIRLSNFCQVHLVCDAHYKECLIGSSSFGHKMAY